MVFICKFNYIHGLPENTGLIFKHIPFDNVYLCVFCVRLIKHGGFIVKLLGSDLTATT